MTGTDQWEQGRPRPRMAPLMLLVAAALLGGVFLGRGGVAPPPAGLVVEEAPAPPRVQADEAAPTPGSRDESAPGPLAERSGAVVVRMGEEVLIWGGVGERPYSDGAIYDPTTQTWRLVASPRLAPRSGAAGVWTGSEAVVMGGLAFDNTTRNPVPVGPARDGVAYDPQTDRWRALPRLPFPLSPDGLFVHGHRLYAVSATARERPVAVLDRGSTIWRLANPAPPWWRGTGKIAARQVGSNVVIYPRSSGRPIALSLPGEQWTPVGTFDGL